jgi:transcriptional regulator GlxA family with amidase domain
MNGNQSNSVRERIELVHRYIRDNIADTIRQTEAAKRVGLSPAAFSRFFHAATGHTFVGFVNTLRVSAACRLLSATDRTITDIAMECGYSNIANFNRQFRCNKGINPSEYRRSLRKRDTHSQSGALSACVSP